MEELALTISAADMEPWVITWQIMTELMGYCFVEKGVCYALGGDLWGKEGGMFSERLLMCEFCRWGRVVS